jgi:hypothetical protein
LKLCSHTTPEVGYDENGAPHRARKNALRAGQGNTFDSNGAKSAASGALYAWSIGIAQGDKNSRDSRRGTSYLLFAEIARIARTFRRAQGTYLLLGPYSCI